MMHLSCYLLLYYAYDPIRLWLLLSGNHFYMSTHESHPIDAPVNPMEVHMRQKLDLWGRSRLAACLLAYVFLPHTTKIAAAARQSTSRKASLCVREARRMNSLSHFFGVSLPPDDKTDRCHLVISHCKSQPKSSGS